MRVPILTWTGIAAIGPVACYSDARPLLHNLLDLNLAEAFWVSLFSCTASFAAAMAALAIGMHGAERFRIESSWGKSSGSLMAATALPIASLWFFIWKAHPIFRPNTPNRDLLLALFAGFLLHLFLWIIATKAAKLLASPVVKWISELPIAGQIGGKGYTRSLGPRNIIHEEHVWNTALFGVYYLAYWAVGLYRGTDLFSDVIANSSVSSGPPTLAFLLAAATFLCLFLAGLTFWLDRYRIPLLLLLTAFSLLAMWNGLGDHAFQVFDQEKMDRVSAQGLFTSRKKIIAVAAAGGGIQAAGWTAKVLSELRAAHPDFAASVRLISAVSGGSVGAMYYMRTYPHSAADNRREWETGKAFRAAVTSSLDPIAWGLVHFDLPRMIGMENNSLADRGWALEKALATRAGLSGIRLSNWSEQVKNGLPAVIFNGTLAESGKPILFSTVDIGINEGIVDFMADRKQDVEIATAVRLSAGFPFVSPAARPKDGISGEHVVDGGYYDNSGMASLMECLREACGSSPCPQEVEVLVLRIVAFPKEAAQPYGQKSWLYELWSPFDAVLGVRSSSQFIRGEHEFNSLKYDLDLREVTLRYQPGEGCNAPSLSWQLSAAEIACLENAWLNLKEKDEVLSFLNGIKTKR